MCPSFCIETKGNIKLKALKRLAVPKKNLPDARKNIIYFVCTFKQQITFLFFLK